MNTVMKSPLDSASAHDITMIGYEADYHRRRHGNYFDEEYYLARAEVSTKRYSLSNLTSCSVLDYGCGLGHNIALLNDAVGYDVSRFAVEFCRARGLRATDDLCDIPDGEMDVVLASHVMEHHPEPLSMLGDIKQKLKPAGTLIVAVPFERHRRQWASADLDQHLFSWTFQTLGNLLTTAGFRVDQTRYVSGTGYRKLLFLRRLHPGLYAWATSVLGMVLNRRELVLVASNVVR
jgi:SAM-dependent methyltransferase